jgi:hypothetical protein
MVWRRWRTGCNSWLRVVVAGRPRRSWSPDLPSSAVTGTGDGGPARHEEQSGHPSRPPADPRKSVDAWARARRGATAAGGRRPEPPRDRPSPRLVICVARQRRRCCQSSTPIMASAFRRSAWSEQIACDCLCTRRSCDGHDQGRRGGLAPIVTLSAHADHPLGNARSGAILAVVLPAPLRRAGSVPPGVNGFPWIRGWGLGWPDCSSCAAGPPSPVPVTAELGRSGGEDRRGRRAGQLVGDSGLIGVAAWRQRRRFCATPILVAALAGMDCDRRGRMASHAAVGAHADHRRAPAVIGVRG